MSSLNGHYWLPVEWGAPANVSAFYTTRAAIENNSALLSTPFSVEQTTDYLDFNLAQHVGDDPDRVNRNRAYLKDALDLPVEPAWLDQIHSNRVIDLDSPDIESQFPYEADGSYTGSASNVCCVMTADCLPVLLSNRKGGWVAAVHAGWRGLASGIIENAVAKYPAASNELVAWLGPAISQPKFEVGVEVKRVFVSLNSDFESAFKPVSHGKYLADLYQLATSVLAGFGIQTFGGSHCTFQESDKFYSYRRQATTGRMASLIWINNQ